MHEVANAVLLRHRSRASTIAWVTWWPVPYWIDRFNALADSPGVSLTVYFLAGQSIDLPSRFSTADWRFNARFVGRNPSSIGYGRPRWRLRNALPLVSERADRLVLIYADPTPLFAAIARGQLRRPYSIFTAATALDLRADRAWKRILKRRVLSNADVILVPGPLQRDYVGKLIGHSSSVRVVGNPTRRVAGEGPLSKGEACAALGVTPPVVLFVGRLAPEKGLPTLLSAAHQLRTDYGMEATLILVGSGPEEEQLRSQARSLGVTARFPGFLEGKALADRYVAADVFVLPSLSEPWGLVVNEAMQYGRPIILSDHVGSRLSLLEEGKNGHSFPAGDAGALAKALARLLANRDVMCEYGARSKQIISSHTISSWVTSVRTALDV